MYRIALVFAFLLASCAESQVGNGHIKVIDTTVPPTQMDNVARDVQQWHNTQYPRCKFDSVVGTKILTQEKDTANEQWTIKACNEKVFSYAVVVVRLSGSILDTVGNADGKPLKIDSSEFK